MDPSPQDTNTLNPVSQFSTSSIQKTEKSSHRTCHTDVTYYTETSPPFRAMLITYNTRPKGLGPATGCHCSYHTFFTSMTLAATTLIWMNTDDQPCIWKLQCSSVLNNQSMIRCRLDASINALIRVFTTQSETSTLEEPSMHPAAWRQPRSG